MDLTLVDLSGVPDAQVGDEVTLLGDSPHHAQWMADQVDTISYEVLCGISSRVPREYVSTSESREFTD